MARVRLSGLPETFPGRSIQHFAAGATLTAARYRWTAERLVTVKIASSRQTIRDDGVKDELPILQRISGTNPKHHGWIFVRKLIDSFTVHGPKAEHKCTVFEALREPLWLYQRRFVGNVIPPDILKILLQMILEALDYLHSECHVIHTGKEKASVIAVGCS